MAQKSSLQVSLGRQVCIRSIYSQGQRAEILRVSRDTHLEIVIFWWELVQYVEQMREKMSLNYIYFWSWKADRADSFLKFIPTEFFFLWPALIKLFETSQHTENREQNLDSE